MLVLTVRARISALSFTPVLMDRYRVASSTPSMALIFSRSSPVKPRSEKIRKSAKPVASKISRVLTSREYHSMLKPRKTPTPRAIMMTMEMNWAL